MSAFQYVQTRELGIINPMFRVAIDVNNTYTDTQDIGFFGQYYNGTNVCYTGLFRDANDSGIYKLYDGLTQLPTVADGSALVNTAGPGFALASLDVANFHAFGSAIIEGDLTINGTTTTINSTTLTVEDNIIVANAGPLDQQPDAGYVIKRVAADVIADDTPKIANDAIFANYTAASTTIQITDPASGTNYFANWILTNSVTHEAVYVTASSNVGTTHTLTLSVGFSSNLTAGTDTVSFYNKSYVGMIWDETNTDITFYGFPRETGVAYITPTGYAGDGNLADYLNLKLGNLNANGTITAGSDITSTAGNITATTGNLTIGGNATVAGSMYAGVYEAEFQIDDNIISVNVGPNHIAPDLGYVGERTPTSVATDDTPLLPTNPIFANYTALATTIQITNAASGTNYFKGWIATNSISGSANAVVITASTNSGTTHTLTLSVGFTSSLTAGTNTINLFNQHYVGWVWHEASQQINIVGFPREMGETDIDPVTPVNGNIPTYTNMTVGNLNVTGTLSATMSITHKTLTQVAPITFSTADIYDYDYIYLAPTVNSTYTLPTIASLGIPANTALVIGFINASASYTALLQTSGSDTIEGYANMQLNRQWLKVVLIASPAYGVWQVKG